MKRQLLSAVAAAALFVGVPAVYAQDAEQPAAGKVCPPDQCPPKGGAEAPAVMPEEQPAQQLQEPSGDGQAAQQPAEEQPAQAEVGKKKPATEADQAQPEEMQAKKKPAAQDTDQAQSGDQVQPEETQASKKQPGDEPTQTGSTNPKVEINKEQAVEIRTVVKEVNVHPIDIDFHVGIGVAVPRTVVLHPLPPRIVEIVPAYADYQFFILADGTIVIVDPVSFHVVYVLYA
jgi:hypothetical protein